MKRIFALIIIAVFTLGANMLLADPIIDKIEAAGKKHTKITGPFTEKRLDKNGTVKSSKEGTLSYIAADKKFEMAYSQPKGDLFLIVGDQMTITKGGKTNNFNLAKNAPMRALRSILTGSISGQISTMAKENDVTVTTATTDQYYVVTLTAKKKVARGYSTIELFYDKTQMYLKKMKMTEWIGHSIVYEM